MPVIASNPAKEIIFAIFMFFSFHAPLDNQQSAQYDFSYQADDV